MEGPERRPGAAPEHRMPGWVRAFVAVGVILAVLVVLGLVLGRGDHGPSRHVPGGEEVGASEGDGHRPPEEHP